MVRGILHTISEYFTTSFFFISDSSTFSEFIRNCSMNSIDKILVSFGIMSLYTIVSFQETVLIYVNDFYRSFLGPATNPRTSFFEFMHLATEEIEFSFEDIMHAEIDGVLMGNTLGMLWLTFLLAIMRDYFLRNVRSCIYIFTLCWSYFFYDCYHKRVNSFSASVKFSAPILGIQYGVRIREFASFSRCFSRKEI